MTKPKVLSMSEAPTQRSALAFPPAFAERLAGLERRSLSGPFGIAGFGVFATTIQAGHGSGLHHRHTTREEFVYVLDGALVLVGDEGETALSAGMCAGFVPGAGHHLENRSDRPAVYLDITAALAGDRVSFPNDDLMLAEGGFAHKVGRPY